MLKETFRDELGPNEPAILLNDLTDALDGAFFSVCNALFLNLSAEWTERFRFHPPKLNFLRTDAGKFRREKREN